LEEEEEEEDSNLEELFESCTGAGMILLIL